MEEWVGNFIITVVETEWLLSKQPEIDMASWYLDKVLA